MVIDHNSLNSLEDELKQEYPKLTWLKNDVQNPYTSRNIGIRSARGKVLAFLDVKGCPSKEWVERGVSRVFSHQEVIVAGKYIIIPPSTDLADQVYGLMYLNNQKNVQYNYGVTTGNLFVHRKAFEKYGTFDEAHISGNDIKWTKRAHLKGAELVYDDGAVVTYFGQSFKELEQSIKKYFSGILHQERESDVSIIFRLKSFMTYLLPMKTSTFANALSYRQLDHLNWKGKCYLWLLTWRMKTKMARAYLNNPSN